VLLRVTRSSRLRNLLFGQGFFFSVVSVVRFHRSYCLDRSLSFSVQNYGNYHSLHVKKDSICACNVTSSTTTNQSKSCERGHRFFREQKEPSCSLTYCICIWPDTSSIIGACVSSFAVPHLLSASTQSRDTPEKRLQQLVGTEQLVRWGCML